MEFKDTNLFVRFLRDSPGYRRPLSPDIGHPGYNFCGFFLDIVSGLFCVSLLWLIFGWLAIYGIAPWVMVLFGYPLPIGLFTGAMIGGASIIVAILTVFLSSVFGWTYLKDNGYMILPDWHFPGKFGEAYRGAKERFCPLVTIKNTQKD